MGLKLRLNLSAARVDTGENWEQEWKNLEPVFEKISRDGYRYRWENIYNRGDPLEFPKEVCRTQLEIRQEYMEEPVSALFLYFEKPEEDEGFLLQISKEGIQPQKLEVWADAYQVQEAEEIWNDYAKSRVVVKDVWYFGQGISGKEYAKMIFPEPFFLKLLEKHHLLDGKQLPWRIFGDRFCMEMRSDTLQGVDEETFQQAEQERMERVNTILQEEAYMLAERQETQEKCRYVYRKEESSFLVIINEYPDGFHSIQYAEKGKDYETDEREISRGLKSTDWEEKRKKAEVSLMKEETWIYASAEKWIPDFLKQWLREYRMERQVKQEQLERLERLRSRSRLVFRFVLQELLAWVEALEMEEEENKAFDTLLEQAEKIGVGRGAECKSSCDFSCYSLPYDFPELVNEVLVTTSVERIEKIWNRRPGKQMELTEPRAYRTVSGYRTVSVPERTDMPEICLVVAYGSSELVTKIMRRRKSLIGKGGCIRGQKNVEYWNEYPYSWENITDILSAALRGFDYKKVKTVLDFYMDFPMTESLTEAVLATTDECLDIVFRKLPHIFGKIEPSKLMERGAYSFRIPIGRTERLKDYYRWMCEKPSFWEFYRIALEHTEEAEKRRILLVDMFHEYVFRREKPEEETAESLEEKKEWYSIFMSCRDCVEDFTEYAGCLFRGCLNNVQLKVDAIEELSLALGMRLPVDVFRMPENFYELKMKKETLQQLMRSIIPMRQKETLDAITGYVVELDDRELTFQAIQYGFIHDGNAVNALKEFQEKNSGHDSRILVMKLIEDTSLMEKYTL